MPKWILKAIVQKIISFFPYKDQLNFFFQKFVTRGVLLDDAHFEIKLSHAGDHIRYFRQYTGSLPSGFTCLELGTGWYPIVPVSLFLAGADHIISVDITSWMTRDSLMATLNMFRQWRQTTHPGKTGNLLEQQLDQIDPVRWKHLEYLLQNEHRFDLPQLCTELRLQSLVQDARHLPLPDHSVDLICSNNTFEHIYPDILSGILKEFQRLIKPGGVMSHFIDLSDHFAHFDPDITIYNFLQFSDRQWRWIDNTIQPQNRLRFKDYRKIYDRLGIPYVTEKVRPGNLEALRKVRLHPYYANYYTEEELAISHGYLISPPGITA